MKNFKFESQNMKVFQKGQHLVWKRNHDNLKDISSFLFSGSYDSSIKYWNIHNEEFIKTLRGHTDWIMALTFIKSKSHLVSSSKDHTVKIWDLRNSNECLNTLLHNRCVTSLFYILEREELITADLDGNINLFDSKYEYIDSISARSEEQSGVWCLEYISEDDLLLIGTEDAKIKIFNLKTKKRIQVISEHTDRVHCLIALNPNQIVTGSWDKTIKVFHKHHSLTSTKKFECERTLFGHKFYVIFIAIIKVTEELISLSEEGTIKIWDARKMWKCIKTMTKHTDIITCCCLRLTSYECELMCDSRENEIKVWDLENGKCKKVFCGHTDVVRVIQIV